MKRKTKIPYKLIFSLVLGASWWVTYAQSPEIPVLNYITVDRQTQKVQLKWSVSNVLVLNGYIIKRQIFNQPGVVDGTFNTIATVGSSVTTTYTDNGTDYGQATPQNRSESYRVASFRLEGSEIVYSNMSNLVSTIYLQPVSFNLCREQNYLTWNAFAGFGNDLVGYKVYYSATAGGNAIKLSDLPKTDTSFVHSGVEANIQYFYFVEAISSSGETSLSNEQGITTTMPSVPSIMNADYTSVNDNESLLLSFTLDNIAEVDSYKLLKSLSKTGAWDTISTFPRGTGNIQWLDTFQTSKEIFFYKVVAKNICKLESRSSNLSNNILLKASMEKDRPTNIKLEWNPYETWIGGVSNYKIFRSIDGGNFEEIAVLPPGKLSYTDNISPFILPEINGMQSQGIFCYYIEANEGLTNPFGIVGNSKSNRSCIHQKPVVFIPNAFNPNSVYEENRTFRPVISFVTNYNLIIYNRWGQVVFSSGDPFQGWDGKARNGQLMPKGTYVYYLKYTSQNKKKIEKSGQINLIY
jgi:gliding motility-associated-like protein